MPVFPGKTDMRRWLRRARIKESVLNLETAVGFVKGFCAKVMMDKEGLVVTPCALSLRWRTVSPTFAMLACPP